MIIPDSSDGFFCFSDDRGPLYKPLCDSGEVAGRSNGEVMDKMIEGDNHFFLPGCCISALVLVATVMGKHHLNGRIGEVRHDDLREHRCIGDGDK